mmetsp:Transcript_26007/g.51001  ORF Transcript_26007/g.51001 Transcript_26007/m.51001 type:complete len:89 (-) Transcript_26007:1722-1988(-)
MCSTQLLKRRNRMLWWNKFAWIRFDWTHSALTERVSKREGDENANAGCSVVPFPSLVFECDIPYSQFRSSFLSVTAYLLCGFRFFFLP